MKENYQLTTDEIKKEYQLTDFTHGLSTQAVEKRLADEGHNIIEVKPTPKWKLFLRQFNNIVIYILLKPFGSYTFYFIQLVIIIIFTVNSIDKKRFIVILNFPLIG